MKRSDTGYPKCKAAQTPTPFQGEQKRYCNIPQHPGPRTRRRLALTSHTAATLLTQVLHGRGRVVTAGKDAATVETQEFGRLLRRMRDDRRLSQRGLAAVTFYSREYVALIERGERSPTTEFVARAENALHTNGALLSGYAKIEDARREATRRRRSAVMGLDDVTNLDDLVLELGQLVKPTPTSHRAIVDARGADLTTAVLDRLRGATLVARNEVGCEHVLPEQVALISAHVAALRRLDDRHGGGSLSLQYATGELRNVIDLLNSANYDLTTGRHLVEIVADLAQLLGWLHFDSSRLGPAERYLLLSIGVSRALAAKARAANAIGMLSYVSAFAGHEEDAVRLAEAAVAECPTGDATLSARLYGRDATAAAANGDLNRFRKSADKAAELLGDGQRSAHRSFLYYLSPSQLAAEAGQGLIILAERTTDGRGRLIDEGIDLLSDSVKAMTEPQKPDGDLPFARSGLVHLAFLARAHLLRDDLDNAVGVIRTGVGLLPSVQSARGRHYLAQLRPRLERRCNSKVVAALLPEFDAALSSL